jgi:hypothetical protein
MMQSMLMHFRPFTLLTQCVVVLLTLNISRESRCCEAGIRTVSYMFFFTLELRASQAPRPSTCLSSYSKCKWVCLSLSSVSHTTMLPLRGGYSGIDNANGGGWLAGKEAPRFKKRRTVLAGRHADEGEEVGGASSRRIIPDGSVRGRRPGRDKSRGREGGRTPYLRSDTEEDIGALEEEHLDMDIGQVLPPQLFALISCRCAALGPHCS